MAEFKYQVQDEVYGNWREVSKQEVLNAVRREMGESLLEEVMKEIHVHGMEFPDGMGKAYRAVHQDGSRIGYEAGCCGQCEKAAA